MVLLLNLINFEEEILNCIWICNNYGSIKDAIGRYTFRLIETINSEEYTNDIVGTLYIPDTEFKATITQTTDNIYYLNHDVDGNSKSKGNPFLDYRDSISNSKVLRIYGHNSRTINTEFHILEEYYKEKYYKDHPYIYFDTNEGTKKYQVFSSYIEAQDWSYYNVNFQKGLGLHEKEC